MKLSDISKVKQKNKIIYRVVESTLDSEYDKKYGIAVYSQTSEGEEKLLSAKNGFTEDRDGLQDLVELCNRLELSTIHLDDVVEDFLT